MQTSTHAPRKRFGQNFLQDPLIIQAIIDAAGLSQSDTVVEIGPGLGALTLPILSRVAHLHVVEIDRDIISHLNAVIVSFGGISRPSH
jgi:16S rRNA (adenine1518-N6/adenine1519-N6)-dimethyltransferase